MNNQNSRIHRRITSRLTTSKIFILLVVNRDVILLLRQCLPCRRKSSLLNYARLNQMVLVLSNYLVHTIILIIITFLVNPDIMFISCLHYFLILLC